MRSFRFVLLFGLFSAACGDDPDGIRDVPLTEERTLPGLADEAFVLRTELDVPHVYAKSMTDLALVQGFVMAQDRYVQIELTRRFGAGTLSELLGELGLSIDYSSRGQGMREIAQRIWDHANPELRARFEAFAAGVNLYIEEVKRKRMKLPEEVELVGGFIGHDEPRDAMQPLTGFDIAAVAAVIVSRLGYESTDLDRTRIERELATAYANTSSTTPIALLDLRRAGATTDIAHNTKPVHPLTSVAPGVRQTTNGLAAAKRLKDQQALRRGAEQRPLKRGAERLAEQRAPKRGAERLAEQRASKRDARLSAERASDRGLGRSPKAPFFIEPATLDRAIAGTKRILAMLGKDQPGEYGSNSWAVSAKGTGGRGALLANDGHLPLTVPSLFYQMCLDTTYFGEDQNYSVCGLFFPGLPLLAVGTNGKVAWGQTYLDADLTDWYSEQVRLGADGLPEASYFRGEWKPLIRQDETYNTPKNGEPKEFDTTTRPQFSTFDGRRIISVEGDVVEDPGSTAVVVSNGDYVVPRDVDGDGKLEAISMDWTALDITKTLEGVDAFAHAGSVNDFVEATRKLIGYGQNIIAADASGGILYSAYHGLPCRDQLPKNGADWAEGANPTRALDGTLYGAFEIPSTEDGKVQESGACVIPFDAGPRAITPEAGYVLTANHDPLGNGIDGSLANDPYYIGGPWDVGYRANTIDTKLAELAAGGAATVEAMSALQGDHTSPLGKEYAPVLLDSMSLAQAIIARGAANEDETRLAAGYQRLGARAAEVQERLAAWVARGAPAASGVETFYDQPTEDDRRDAVATMIHAEWLRLFVDDTFLDEGIDFAFTPSRGEKTYRALHQVVAGRGAGNPLGLASWNMATEESAFFDRIDTAPIERSHEVMLMALERALDVLASADRFNTPDMSQWLWGMQHHVRFRALLEEVAAGNPLAGILAFKFAINTKTLPLAPDLPASDPRSKLENFPRSGDFFSVDVAAGGFSGPYTYSHGPVMRMVISLDGETISGVNILPGGQSGLAGDPHFADQAAKWLANETIPLRYHAADVVAGAEGNEKMSPPK